MGNRSIKLSIALTSLAVCSVSASYCLNSSEKYSVRDVISYYGFTSLNQQESFIDLLQKSAIIPANQGINDKYPRRNNENELASDLLDLVRKTQEKFTLRSGSQERWQIKPIEWMEKDQEKILSDLKTLGFVYAIAPSMRRTDAVCILGATKPKMANRIQYLEFLFNNGFTANTIILLSGERFATLNVDASEEELSLIAKKYGVSDWKRLTETHLIQSEYETSSLSKRKLDTYVINTPARELPRPTTETTILELIKWLKNHPDIRTILFISNQPYTKYQDAVISLVLREKGIDIKFEVVGSAVTNFSDIQPIIEGLGSYLFAAFPIVLSKMNLQISDQNINKEFKELYSKNPLFYKNIPSSFELMPRNQLNREMSAT